MTFLVVVVVLVGLALIGGWWIDRSTAKRGYRVSGVRHTGLRREITYTKLGDDGRPAPHDADPRS
jgi:hypothetical protein